MNWNDLAAKIAQMTEDQRTDEVTLKDADGEYFPATLSITGEDEDVLDPNTFFLENKDE